MAVQLQGAYTLFILTLVIWFVAEIYKIVSQKQIRDSPDDDNSPSGNVQTISVAPTVNSNAGKKQCCSV